VDATRAKRVLMSGAAILVTTTSLLLPLLHGFWPVATAQAVAHAAGTVFPPALAAVSLGVFGHHAFTGRIGRNETFNHADNATAAAVAGGGAYLLGPTVVFYLLAVMSVASLLSIVCIPGVAIDHELARGLHGQEQDQESRQGSHQGTQAEQPAGFAILLTCRPLLIFAACVMLFHLSNAAMLPLVGQKLALEDKNLGTSLMSACIVAAQIVMAPMAMLVGARADHWGHKRFFLASLVILPIRGALYTLSDSPAWLVGVQLLDGVGAGIFGAIFPVIVADLMRNTGRFNVAQGAVTAAQNIGAALSTSLAGLVVVKAGYSAAFLTLGAIAALGVLVCALALPETRDGANPTATPLDRRAIAA
jgi:hypothetical protein